MSGSPVLEAIEVALPDRGLCPTVFRGGFGSPLVYLHSASGMSAADPVALALSRTHDVYAPVHPGFEDPADAAEIWDVHDLALYYDELLETLRLDGVPVIGHSFGAMVAAELAAHVPNRVCRLVLAAPIGLWNDREPVADLFAASPTEIGELVWADPEGPIAQADMAVGMSQALAALGEFLWPIPDKGLRRRLHRISAPTLIVWGSEDRFVPVTYAADFAAEIRDATLEVLSGAGHMAPVERVAEFAVCVQKFLARAAQMTTTGE